MSLNTNQYNIKVDSKKYKYKISDRYNNAKTKNTSPHLMVISFQNHICNWWYWCAWGRDGKLWWRINLTTVCSIIWKINIQKHTIKVYIIMNKAHISKARTNIFYKCIQKTKHYIHWTRSKGIMVKYFQKECYILC